MESFPLLTEIAGPAGSGKSTVVARLTSLPGVIAPHLPAPVDSIKAVARALAGQWSGLGRSSADRAVIRSLARLEHWARLSRLAGPDHARFIIDQGPVYRIIQVTERLALPSQAGWWSDQLRAWSEMLDAVVYLDAPDEVLLARIHDRAKDHRLQAVSRESAQDELARARARFEQALSRLEEGGVDILRIDTDSVDPSAIERAIAPRLGVGG